MSIFRDIDDIIRDTRLQPTQPTAVVTNSNENQDEILSISADSDVIEKYYLMEADGTIKKSSTKLKPRQYQPLDLYNNDEKLGEYKKVDIQDDIQNNLFQYKTDVTLTNYNPDSSEDEMNNITVLNKEYSNNVFRYVGGYKNMDLKYQKKLNKIKNKLDKIKLEYPEYYYLNGGLKLDHKINKESNCDNINFSNVEKLINKFKKFRI